jgi:hypothetical protein
MTCGWRETDAGARDIVIVDINESSVRRWRRL